MADKDPINPSHYTDLAIPPIQFIKANNLEWNVANCIKYLSRYKLKNGFVDCLKSHWYLVDLLNDEYAKLSEEDKKKYAEKMAKIADSNK